MALPEITYAQLLETNNIIQTSADETYWLCVTRTVQESKLFPVPAYMMLSYLNSYYRYPTLLRKIDEAMPAEALGDRARDMGSKINTLTVGWAMPGFYLLGRQWLLELGMLRPQDALEDLVFVLDFWKRFQLAYHRNDGHITNKEYGHRAQLHPERRVQVFQSDLFDCAEGDDLHQAATAFMATVSQYGFLISCESRISLHNTGPYRLADGRQLLVRDFMDLAEGDYPWLDDVAAGMPYNNLTVTLALSDCVVYLADDWGSFETRPEFQSHHVSGVGLYTSDPLTDGYLPVGMSSPEELTRTLRDLSEICKAASEKLWQRIASWTRDQMMDAGALIYFSIFKDLAHVAGVYEMEDWMLIDERAERFRPLLNDEYSRDVLVELCVGLLPSQRLGDHALMQHGDGPTRLYSHVPYAVLADEAFTRTSGGLRPGASVLPRKNDRYRTSQGVLTLDEYNRRAREAVPAAHDGAHRFHCETWVKYHWDEPDADALYRLEQRRSRTLRDVGAGLRDPDLPAASGRQAAAPERRPSAHDVLHALAVVKRGDADHVAAILGSEADLVEPVLAAAATGGLVAVTGASYTLVPLATLAIQAECGRDHGASRADAAFCSAFDSFEAVNDQLKTLITKWQTIQIGGRTVSNDHSDPAYDHKVIDRLSALHARVEPVLDQLAAGLPRLAAYRARLADAMGHIEKGDIAWVSDAKIPSYHTVWFELHDDLLRLLGRERQE